MEKRLLNITELSEYIGLTKGTIYVWVCHRKIPVVKMGRLLKFDKIAIDKWIETKKRDEDDFSDFEMP
ncbi:MAG TPA: transcriptional regulator [Elusimicrobia bacterium]|nr:MAG: hypothetical protein A2278_04245 [Elusimicrobia bacterium RIFOXYA12_FULL_49_49]OGS09779.1 MAG: hypothetical protein A2204_01245 [Elusimicrobia bacterium RIFOXYA1_FULL_47_7]OGS10515.1 MAG: hypothetical protein A2386_05425 [Elusimicrobia bacterium RIFOXYB1_FULL_48_9]OGS14739.1 MAG: hypothetical protein A2251_09600 [Elusimicrobia bacterium RIFOXYA2_FULL_47_53]OGS25609.1 MAG: hypothetical protein A2339_05990 [Elusimicrobia bacterium RIFOXYB12_FULL_50_12]OGS31830.1 MAG: hypothetical protein